MPSPCCPPTIQVSSDRIADSPKTMDRTAGPVPVMSPYSPGRLTGVLNCSTIQHGRGTAGPAGAGPLSAKVGGGRMAMAPTDVSRLLDDPPPDFDRQRFAAVYAEAAGAAAAARTPGREPGYRLLHGHRVARLGLELLDQP